MSTNMQSSSKTNFAQNAMDLAVESDSALIDIENLDTTSSSSRTKQYRNEIRSLVRESKNGKGQVQEQHNSRRLIYTKNSKGEGEDYKAPHGKSRFIDHTPTHRLATNCDYNMHGMSVGAPNPNNVYTHALCGNVGRRCKNGIDSINLSIPYQATGRIRNLDVLGDLTNFCNDVSSSCSTITSNNNTAMASEPSIVITYINGLSTENRKPSVRAFSQPNVVLPSIEQSKATGFKTKKVLSGREYDSLTFHLFFLWVFLSVFLNTMAGLVGLALWDVSHNYLMYASLVCILICIIMTSTIIGYCLLHLDHPLVKSRGHTFLRVFLGSIVSSLFFHQIDSCASIGLIDLGWFRPIAGSLATATFSFALGSMATRQRIVYLLCGRREFVSVSRSDALRQYTITFIVMQIPCAIVTVLYMYTFFAGHLSMFHEVQTYSLFVNMAFFVFVNSYYTFLCRKVHVQFSDWRHNGRTCIFNLAAHLGEPNTISVSILTPHGSTGTRLLHQRMSVPVAAVDRRVCCTDIVEHSVSSNDTSHLKQENSQ
eukprot:CFRG8657